jgi:hypothetical protein
MIFVGADVHVRNTYFYGTDAEGRRWAHGRVGNTPAELCGFCEALLRGAGGEVQPVRFVLESTTSSRAVQGLLRPAAKRSFGSVCRSGTVRRAAGGSRSRVERRRLKPRWPEPRSRPATRPSPYVSRRSKATAWAHAACARPNGYVQRLLPRRRAPVGRLE